jgi:hypothetical protein
MEFGLRPVGAIGAYAPEGIGLAECGVKDYSSIVIRHSRHSPFQKVRIVRQLPPLKKGVVANDPNHSTISTILTI